MERPEDTRLHEYTKEEWRDIMRIAVRRCGGVFDEDKFEESWTGFIELKRRKQLN